MLAVRSTASAAHLWDIHLFFFLGFARCLKPDISGSSSHMQVGLLCHELPDLFREKNPLVPVGFFLVLGEELVIR